MRLWIRLFRRRSATSVLVAVAAFAAVPSTALAQYESVFQDGRIPNKGQFWLQFTPSLHSWHQQFALNSPDPKIPDGGKEPLIIDFQGPITGRHYPGVEPILADLNGDAGALGFDSIAPADFALGNLDYSTMNAQARKLDLRLEYGLTRRISIEAGATLTQTAMDPVFVYDSTASSMLAGMSVVPSPAAFFGDFQAALGSLQGVIDSGSLTPEETVVAMALLESSGLFKTALERRVGGNLVLPIGTSAAGAQMRAYYEALSAGYAAFQLGLPELTVPDTATSFDMTGFFQAQPVVAQAPAETVRGWGVGEVEIGGRFLLLDQFGDRVSPYRPRFDDEPDSTRVPDPRLAALQRKMFRFRTTVGAKARIPIKPANVPPLNDPTSYFDIPIADGQPDVELAVYQDVVFKNRWWLTAAVRYGLQLPDRLDRRVYTPDQPYAHATTSSVVKRNLGDYLSVRLSPQFRITDVISIGLEYGFWNKGSDSYTLESTVGGLTDASALELETGQSRHRLGLGVFYRMAEGADREDPRPPWLFGFVFQSAIGGSGGQTPVAQLATVTMRIPIQIF
jgi:hypothetical protein